MIQTLTRQIARVATCTVIGATLGSVRPCIAEGETGEKRVLPLSTAYVPVPGEAAGKMLYTTVEWGEHEYQAQEGTTVLMKVIVDAATDSSVRAKALERLSRLRNRDTTPQLLSLYDDLREAEEKAWLLRCLTSAEDPRGLPLFARVLEQETDDTVRMVAAFSLAQWNVRRGVEELVGLLDSGAPTAQTDRMKYDLDTVINVFATENRRKSWGFPFEKVAKSIGERTDLADEQKASLLASEIKKWFSENKDRFPDWNLGDPLPAAPKLPPIPPGPTSVLSLSATFRPPLTTWTTAEQEEAKVDWEGEPLPVEQGVERLMTAILGPSSGDERARAFLRLEQVAGHLRDTDHIPQLLDLYEQLSGRAERAPLVFCLAESKDARTLALFARILDGRTEDLVRLPAAYGLAIWNVRRGVSELIDLLLVREGEGAAQHPGNVAWQAARRLSRLNYWKSWCAPDASLQAAVEAPPEVRDERLQACHSELKVWFAANKHRFPEWKPGDPLPEAAANDNSEGDPN